MTQPAYHYCLTCREPAKQTGIKYHYGEPIAALGGDVEHGPLMGFSVTFVCGDGHSSTYHYSWQNSTNPPATQN
jgi:hypothetical protein